MLKPMILLLDLALIASMANNTPTFSNFVLVVVFAIKFKLGTAVHWQSDLQVAPSKVINALLQSTEALHTETCPICRHRFFLPHMVSCGHVFCHDCALLTFAKRDTCPICLRVPHRLRAVDMTITFEQLVESWLVWIIRWVQVNWMFSVGWIVSCVWQLRSPRSSEVMLAAMRTSIHLALQPMLVDVLDSARLIRLHHEQRDVLANIIATAFAIVITLFYTYGTLAYLALIIVSMVCQIHYPQPEN
jgi:aryl carrier-like protein